MVPLPRRPACHAHRHLPGHGEGAPKARWAQSCTGLRVQPQWSRLSVQTDGEEGKGLPRNSPSEHAESTCERMVIKSHYLQAVGLQVKRETKGKYRFRCPHPNSRAKKDIRLRQRPACQGRRSEAVGGQSPSEREVPLTPNTEHLLLLEGEF